jgi:hypothetical protein
MNRYGSAASNTAGYRTRDLQHDGPVFRHATVGIGKDRNSIPLDRQSSASRCNPSSETSSRSRRLTTISGPEAFHSPISVSSQSSARGRAEIAIRPAPDSSIQCNRDILKASNSANDFASPVARMSAATSATTLTPLGYRLAHPGYDSLIPARPCCAARSTPRPLCGYGCRDHPRRAACRRRSAPGRRRACRGCA